MFVHSQRNIPLIDNETLPPNSVLLESLPKEGQSDKKIYLISVPPSNIIKLVIFGDILDNLTQSRGEDMKLM